MWRGPNANHVIIGNSDVKGEYSTDGGQTFGFGYTGDSYNSMFRVIQHANGNLYAAVGSLHDLYQSTTLTDSLIDSATGRGVVLHEPGRDLAGAARLRPRGRLGRHRSDQRQPALRRRGRQHHDHRRHLGHEQSQCRCVFDLDRIADAAANAGPSARHRRAQRRLGVGELLRPADDQLHRQLRRLPLQSDDGKPGPTAARRGMDYWTKDVVVDPNDPTQNTWYAGVYSGWGGQANGLGGLYKTTNRGQSWTLLTSGLDVESITFNPSKPSEAFMTTETQGLWYSSNMTAATPTFTQVANYPFRQPERVFFNPFNTNEVWVTSFGGGVFVGNTATAPTVANVQVNDGTAQRSEVRSIAVTLSGPVTFAGGAAAAFQLQHVQDGVNVALAAAVSTDVQGRTVVTLTFSGTETDPVSGLNGGIASLADGRYSLTILSSQVSANGHGAGRRRAERQLRQPDRHLRRHWAAPVPPLRRRERRRRRRCHRSGPAAIRVQLATAAVRHTSGSWTRTTAAPSTPATWGSSGRDSTSTSF